jgi:hypothetical protein
MKVTEDQNQNETTQQDDVEGHGFGGKGGKREGANTMFGEKDLRVLRSDESTEEDDVEGHGFGGKGGKRESADVMFGDKGRLVYRDDESSNDEEDVEGHSLRL